MSNKSLSQAVVVPGALSIIVLALTVALVTAGRFDSVKVLGFLIGLAGGYLCGVLVLLERAARARKQRKTFRAAALVIGPLCFVALLAVSPGFGAGYFAGAGVVICFISSVAALIKDEQAGE